MGADRPAGIGRSGRRRGRARGPVPGRIAEWVGVVGRGRDDRDRLPACVLSEVPPVPAFVSALRAGALPRAVAAARRRSAKGGDGGVRTRVMGPAEAGLTGPAEAGLTGPAEAGLTGPAKAGLYR